MLCLNCGKEVPDESKICPYCGTELPIEGMPEERKKTKRKRGLLFIPFIVFLTIVGIFTYLKFLPSKQAATSEAIWPMSGYNAQHTGQCPYDTSKNRGVIVWKYKTESFIDLSPVISSDGTVYVDDSVYLYAINQDGSLKWKVEVGSSYLFPAIGLGGVIYTISQEYSKEAYLCAIKPGGTVKWKHDIGYLPCGGIAIDSNGTIYFGASKYIEPSDFYLYAMTPDENVKWKYKVTYSFTCPAIGKDGTIYIATSEGTMFAINSDGTLKWKSEIGGGCSSEPLSIGPDGTIYCGSLDKNLYAVNSDGTLKWKCQTEGSVASSPAVATDGTIFVGSCDFYLYAINQNGTLKWKYKIGYWYYETGQGIFSSPVVSSEGTVYILGNPGYLFAFSPDGALKWKTEAISLGIRSPVISSNGTIYIGSRDGNLYAVR